MCLIFNRGALSSDVNTQNTIILLLLLYVWGHNVYINELLSARLPQMDIIGKE